VWDSLLEKNDGEQPLPRYLQLLALVSFHAFIREGVEAAIFETHHGGEYDATNVIDHPIATVITSLGMDHAKQLGPTIENIAWHKSGIFKHGAQAFSAPQEVGAAEILRSRAAKKNVKIQFVADDQSLPNIVPQLTPNVQRMNCSIALATVRFFLKMKAPNELGPILPSDVQRGIEQFSWPGRFQVLSEGTFQWFLDGAHNEMSVAKAAEWFVEMSQMQRYVLHSSTLPSVVSKRR
jgi:folylpolyglutamate synthase